MVYPKTDKQTRATYEMHNFVIFPDRYAIYSNGLVMNMENGMYILQISTDRYAIYSNSDSSLCSSAAILSPLLSTENS